MKCEFVLFGIKNIELLYKRNEEGKTEYVAVQYFTNVFGKLYEKVNCLPEIEYHCDFQRKANEVFIIPVSTEYYYQIILRIDSYNDKEKLTVTLEKLYFDEDSSDNKEDTFDELFENVKLQLKNIFLETWNKCIWITDEQSEQLCTLLYPSIFKTESAIRAFASKVLVSQIGPDWINLPGMEKYRDSCRVLNTKFMRYVPEYHSVDTNFMSMTLETDFEIIKKGKIYKSQLHISEENERKISELLRDSKNANKLQDLMNSLREVQIDIWRDIFSKYLVDDMFDSQLTDFIANRNHVAHNKLINIQAYKKINANVVRIQTMIHKADSSFETERLSEEQKATIIPEGSDGYLNETDLVQAYIRYRLDGEDGLYLRNRQEIFNLFRDLCNAFSMQIRDGLYFHKNIFVKENTELHMTENDVPQSIMKLRCNGQCDKRVEVQYLLDDKIGEDSEMSFTILNEETETAEITGTCYYHNGSGYEDFFDGTIVVDRKSSLDTSELTEVINWTLNMDNVVVETKTVRKQNLSHNKNAYQKLKNNMVPSQMKLGKFRNYYKPVLSHKEKELLLKIGYDPYSYEGLKYYGDCKRFHKKLGEPLEPIEVTE